MKLAGRPVSENIERETRPPRDLLDWLVDLPVYSANGWRNTLFPANVGLPRIDFNPAKLQAEIDRDYAQKVAATNRDIIREAGRNDIIPISKGDNFYLLGPDRKKVVEGYDSPFFQQSIARAAGVDAPPELKTWNHVTSAAKARKVEPAVGSGAMRLSSSIPQDVIDTLIAEAGGNEDGLRAVAHVINNRATQWGMTPEQVVKQKGQFEGYYNPGPKSREAQKSAKVRAKAEAAWQAVQAGTAPDPTNGGTSFRARGTKQPAPNGTVEIGGNVFALGSGASNSALAAINAVAPTPMPARPAELSALAPLPNDNMLALQSALNAKAERMRNGTDRVPVPRAVPPQIAAQRSAPPPLLAPTLTAAQRSAIADPGRGVGTSYLAPATKVKTVPIDPTTGIPIVAQPPKQPIDSANAPKPKNRDGMWFTSQPPTGPSIPSPQQTIMDRPGFAGIPVIGPLAVGVGTALDLVKNRPSAGAVASPPPQPTKLPSVIPEKAGPPAPPRSVPKADTSIGSFVTQFGSNTGKPAPLPPKPPKVADRIPAGDVQKDAFVQTFYPQTYTPDAIKRGQDIASALYPKPATPSAVSAINAATLPRLPMLPTAAMSAARLPTVPVRTAPLTAARIPLTQTRAANPMTQIVPAVQARAGQGLLGGLLNMLTAGNVPQANTQQRAPQNYPTPIPGQTGVEINGVDLAFMPKSVQQSSRWRTGY